MMPPESVTQVRGILFPTVKESQILFKPQAVFPPSFSFPFRFLPYRIIGYPCRCDFLMQKYSGLSGRQVPLC